LTCDETEKNQRMPTLITLSCPSCGASIRIPEESNRFTCDYCGNQHLLHLPVQPGAAAAAVGQAAAVEPAAIRPRVPLPQSIRIERDEDSARILRRWWSPSYLFMAVFAISWDAFLIFWYTTVAVSGAPWIFAAFPVIHLAVGIAITYTTLAGFVNRTVVELTREELAIWHEPLPWGGEKTLKTADIKQLYCKKHVKHGKHGPRYSYELFAVTQDDLQVKLLSGLTTPDLAQFFEQQLESWMKIKNRRVIGELAN
jgi:ribosomal protein S27AE